MIATNEWYYNRETSRRGSVEWRFRRAANTPRDRSQRSFLHTHFPALRKVAIPVAPGDWVAVPRIGDRSAAREEANNQQRPGHAHPLCMSTPLPFPMLRASILRQDVTQ